MSIISLKHKFAFIKTKKVAGTSVEAVLRRYTGDDDIVPAVTPRDEHYMALENSFSRNYLKDKSQEVVYTEIVLSGAFEQAAEFLSQQKKIAYSHMTYEKVRNLIESLGYSTSDFYIFTIDRHPYSWLLSNVTYSNAQYNSFGSVDVQSRLRKANDSIEALLDRNDFLDIINWTKYTSNGEVLVDKVIDYDNLNSGLLYVFEALGLHIENLDLPDLKKGSREWDARDILNESNRKKAQTKFRSLFNFMGYKI
jgi:hypothetical protein